jgi:very-short-patch-repair endonuclease
VRSPQEKIALYAYDRALAEVNQLCSEDSPPLGSPIEKLLWSALLTVLFADRDYPVASNRAPAVGEVGLSVQAKVEKFRVDFMVSVQNSRTGKYHHLVIECDGHDFHERTKDQAKKDRSRDRRLQELGYTIYRFTGSEIFNDPISCVSTIIEWVAAASWRRD